MLFFPEEKYQIHSGTCLLETVNDSGCVRLMFVLCLIQRSLSEAPGPEERKWEAVGWSETGFAKDQKESVDRNHIHQHGVSISHLFTTQELGLCALDTWCGWVMFFLLGRQSHKVLVLVHVVSLRCVLSLNYMCAWVRASHLWCYFSHFGQYTWISFPRYTLH